MAAFLADLFLSFTKKAGDCVDQYLHINENTIRLSNLEKIFWPEDGFTKADLIKYYIEMSNIILPYIKDRPLVMSRYPEGIKGENFYHKHHPQKQVPPYLKTCQIYSRERKEGINYLIGAGVETLIYQANLGAIEIHPWFSRVQNLDYPDWAIFDLDPALGATFADTVVIAKLIHQVLEQLKVHHYPKTSGATGLHIYVPVEPIYTYNQLKEFIELIGWLVVQITPAKATIYDRMVKDRIGKVYIDYLQNTKGKTITGVYSVRPLKCAPISTPLYWDEVVYYLKPEKFTLKTIAERIAVEGDIFQPVLTNKQKIDSVIQFLRNEIVSTK